MSSRGQAVPLAALLSLSLYVLSPSVGWSRPADGEALAGRPAAWTVGDLFGSVAPYALGHRGYGINAGADPTRPIENTLDAFHQSFRDGIRVVELDLQRTADGKIVVFHDDYLADFTCVRSLTHGELLARHPNVPLFRAVLNSSRHFDRSDDLSGIIFAEIKVPVPHCDGSNTSAQAEITESALVAAVVEDIRRARMEDQVVLNSMSPSILRQALLQAPEIKRALSLNVLQLLPPEQVGPLTGLPVVKIPKNDCGLEWYNIGPIARLPAMPGASFMQKFGSFIGVARGCTGAQAASVDKLVLLQAGAQAPNLVAALHGNGLEAIVWTVDTQSEWNFLAQAGVDGITTNNIPLGLASQAPLPEALASNGRSWGNSMHAARVAESPESAPVLALAPARSNPTPDGTARIAFTLPDGGPARLELVDVAGRMVEASDVGSYGPGRHEFIFGRDLRPGMYLVRLTHARGQARAKIAVTR